MITLARARCLTGATTWRNSISKFYCLHNKSYKEATILSALFTQLRPLPLNNSYKEGTIISALFTQLRPLPLNNCNKEGTILSAPFTQLRPLPLNNSLTSLQMKSNPKKPINRYNEQLDNLCQGFRCHSLSSTDSSSQLANNQDATIATSDSNHSTNLVHPLHV